MNNLEKRSLDTVTNKETETEKKELTQKMINELTKICEDFKNFKQEEGERINFDFKEKMLEKLNELQISAREYNYGANTEIINILRSRVSLIGCDYPDRHSFYDEQREAVGSVKLVLDCFENNETADKKELMQKISDKLIEAYEKYRKIDFRFDSKKNNIMRSGVDIEIQNILDKKSLNNLMEDTNDSIIVKKLQEEFKRLTDYYVTRDPNLYNKASKDAFDSLELVLLSCDSFTEKEDKKTVLKINSENNIYARG